MAPTGCSKSAAPSTTARSAPASGSVSTPPMTRSPQWLPQPDPQSRDSPLPELELIDRERRTIERRIKEARFLTVKSLDSFDFATIPSLNKTLILELARCEYIAHRENVIAVGNSGTGKTHI